MEKKLQNDFMNVFKRAIIDLEQGELEGFAFVGLRKSGETQLSYFGEAMGFPLAAAEVLKMEYNDKLRHKFGIGTQHAISLPASEVPPELQSVLKKMFNKKHETVM